MSLFYVVTYLCGFLMCGIQLYWLFRNKNNKLSSADTLYGSIISLIAAWILFDLLNFLDLSFGVASFYLVTMVLLTTMIAILGDLFALSLKREIQVIDVIILFPVLLISVFYGLEGNWNTTTINGVVYNHVLSNDTFYWLSCILFVILLNLNVLYRVSSWFKGTWAYKRVFGLIITETVGITLAIVANVFFYPWLLPVRLGSFFLGFSLFLNFWFDQKLAKKKLRCPVKGGSERDESMRRVCEFL